MRYKNKIRGTRSKTLSIYGETIIAVSAMSLQITFSEQARSIVSNLILSTEKGFSYFPIILGHKYIVAAYRSPESTSTKKL